MNYKLLATDMDGTLFNDREEISEENIEAIIELQKKGIKFVLASGRPGFAIFESAKKLKMDKSGGYILSFNGGEIIDFSTGKVLFKESLNMEDIEKIYAESKETGVPFIVYSGDTIYGNSYSTKIEADICKMKFIKFETPDDLKKAGVTETVKCMFISEPERINETEKHVKSKYENDYFIATSKPIFLEIVNKNVNKGKTLAKLAELLGISVEETVAVGDGANDIPMFKAVGVSVAVANASEKVRRAAKFETVSNNENALKAVIEKFF